MKVVDPVPTSVGRGQEPRTIPTSIRSAISQAVSAVKGNRRRSAITFDSFAKQTKIVLKPSLHVAVPPIVYCMIWIGVVFMHILLAVYFIALSLFYWYLPSTVLINWFIIYGVIIDPSGCPYISAGYAVFGAINTISAARILITSARAQRVVLSSTAVAAPTTKQEGSKKRFLTKRQRRIISQSTILCRWFDPVVSGVSVWFNWVVGLLFESKNDQFESTYRVGKLIQSIIQFQQVYLASQTLSRLWLLNGWATLLILNCTSAPLIFRLVRGDGAKQRLLSVVLELMLDTSSLMLQLVLAIPYLKQYHTGLTNFEPIQWYQDRWFVHAINEFQVMLISTMVGLVSRLIIVASATRGLHTIATTITLGDVKLAYVHAFKEDSPPPVKKEDSAPIVDIPTEPAPPSAPTARTASATSGKKSIFNLVNLATMLSILLGICAFLIHIIALSATHEEACVHPLYPWLASLSKSPCSFAQYNCQKYANHTGTVDQTTHFLERFNAQYLALLVIRKCPDLHVPPAIQTASHLLELKIVDSTISQWGDDAALTQTDHPHLRYTAIANVTMTAFPQGLMSSDFPPALADIEICRSTIAGPMPDTLDTVWPKDAFVIMEEMKLTQVPPVLTRIDPWAISFANNQLTSIPDGIVTNDHTTFTILNGNPLTALPNVTAVGASFTMVNISGTQITTIPKAYAHLTVSAWGTTLCACGEPICECQPPQCEESQKIECFDPHGNYTMFPINVEHIINPP